MLSPGIVYETLTVLGTPVHTYTTPLGVVWTGELIYARIYPGTRLTSIAGEALEACIAFPLKPDPFLDYFESRWFRLESARALRTPCIPGQYFYIEAVVVGRERWLNDGYTLYMEPVTIRYSDTIVPEGYTRVMGCTIELLISYTRAVYWSSKRPPDCQAAHANLLRMRDSLECIRRTDLTRQVYTRARRLLEKAGSIAVVNGCPWLERLELSGPSNTV